MACIVAGCTPADKTDTRFTTWTRYEGQPGATSFSALDQIDRSNVSQLEEVWRYETPGAGPINPIIIDSIMYVVGEDDAVVALHAGTGKKIWSHTSALPGRMRTHGVMYWESEDRSERRLLFQKGSNTMLAIDPLTGVPVEAFGEGGHIDMRHGLGTDPELITRSTSPTPGVIFEDLVILGSSPGEGYFASPGHIRAFNVRTGKQEWIFHTLPKPGEYGYDTWPEGRSDEAGGANAWGGLSVDDKRGIVYVPLGSANYDFYGVDRHGENLFANSLVALNARTGERVWHFQTVHHDLWDYDLTATPVLLTINHEGEPVDIVVLATKTGFVFVFNRETGEPIWPIEERPVPRSDMPGEQAWPTQPFPTWPEPFIPLTLSLEDDLNPHLLAEERDSIYEAVRNMRYEGMFTPPSTTPTLQIPGNRGGANWGSTAGDPRDGTFFVLSYNMPSVLHLLPIVAGKVGTGASPFDRGQNIYQSNCQICHGAGRRGQPTSGIPSLIGVTNRMSHVEFQDVIRAGRGTMPAFPQLSSSEFEYLQLFLSNPELALVPEQMLTSGEAPLPNPATPVRYQSGWIHILDSKGVPVIKPPWFRLTAYDMNDGTIKWQVPVGNVPHLEAEGVFETGATAFLKGGPAITAGGLVFLGTHSGLRAYDSETGEALWSAPLPATGDGIPAVYEIDGRQFVAVAAPLGDQYGQPLPDSLFTPSYVAFALPTSPSNP